MLDRKVGKFELPSSNTFLSYRIKKDKAGGQFDSPPPGNIGIDPYVWNIEGFHNEVAIKKELIPFWGFLLYLKKF